MRRFENKIALITGSGSGIGLATAHRLRDEGATVVCSVQREDQLAAVSEFDALVLDVTKTEHWTNAKAHLEHLFLTRGQRRQDLARMGRQISLDDLVGNAGLLLVL